MDEYIEKYIHARNKMNEYSKYMDDYKNKIKTLLKEETNMSYSKNGLEAQIKTMYKSTIQKKNIPEELWEKYSSTTPYEVLNVKKK